ncbi:hypothetical protein cyc_00730 [Cyclospora cayetanensis]|uniref:Transmembrane protein n=1 Tax=Cyclospora cayetanensis TaxID=88456 RepID=A0A1D3CUB1_9EIME|nr:hypothetical protein cyc_00730 [Cyclospora cayetanensis]
MSVVGVGAEESNQPWTLIPSMEPLPTRHAEKAMPPVSGRITVLVGVVLLLVYLCLTEWRVKEQSNLNEVEARIKAAQDKVAGTLNTGLTAVNDRLGNTGHAFSGRLALYLTALICILVGSVDLLRAGVLLLGTAVAAEASTVCVGLFLKALKSPVGKVLEKVAKKHKASKQHHLYISTDCTAAEAPRATGRSANITAYAAVATAAPTPESQLEGKIVMPTNGAVCSGALLLLNMPCDVVPQAMYAKIDVQSCKELARLDIPAIAADESVVAPAVAAGNARACVSPLSNALLNINTPCGQVQQEASLFVLSSRDVFLHSNSLRPLQYAVPVASHVSEQQRRRRGGGNAVPYPGCAFYQQPVSPPAMATVAGTPAAASNNGSRTKTFRGLKYLQTQKQ